MSVFAIAMALPFLAVDFGRGQSDPNPCRFANDIVNFVRFHHYENRLACDHVEEGGRLLFEFLPIMVCLAGYHKYNEAYYHQYKNGSSVYGPYGLHSTTDRIQDAQCEGLDLMYKYYGGRMDKIRCVLCILSRNAHSLSFYKKICGPKYTRNLTCHLDTDTVTIYDPLYNNVLIDAYNIPGSFNEDIIHRLEKLSSESTNGSTTVQYVWVVVILLVAVTLCIVCIVMAVKRCCRRGGPK